MLALNSGCYEYRPYETGGPQLGDRIALELSDQGRASLGNLLGPGVLRIEGTLVESNAQQYVVSVNSISTIGGGSSQWTGERVTIPVSDVAQTRQRTVSKLRSALLAGAVVVGLGVFVATRQLFGSGTTAAPDSVGKTPLGT